jgi:hypothetical protein
MTIITHNGPDGERTVRFESSGGTCIMGLTPYEEEQTDLFIYLLTKIKPN